MIESLDTYSAPFPGIDFVIGSRIENEIGSLTTISVFNTLTVFLRDLFFQKVLRNP